MTDWDRLRIEREDYERQIKEWQEQGRFDFWDSEPVTVPDKIRSLRHRLKNLLGSRRATKALEEYRDFSASFRSMRSLRERLLSHNADIRAVIKKIRSLEDRAEEL